MLKVFFDLLKKFLNIFLMNNLITLTTKSLSIKINSHQRNTPTYLLKLIVSNLSNVFYFKILPVYTHE